MDFNHFFTLIRIVSVDTCPLCARQIVDSPPANLQQDEADNQHPKGHLNTRLRQTAIVDESQIAEPRDGSPRLFWVPSPIVPPSLLCPKGTKEHSEGHESQSDIYQIVGDVHLLWCRWLIGAAEFRTKTSTTVATWSFHRSSFRHLESSLEEKQINRHHRGCTQQGVGEHIDNDMRGEPRTLKRWHERLRMNLRLEKVDANEDKSQQRRERENPLVVPATIDDDARQRQKERIPQASLAHRAKWRPFEGNPQPYDESEKHHQTSNRCNISRARLVAPSGISACYPKQYGNNGEIGKMTPTHNVSSFLSSSLSSSLTRGFEGFPPINRNTAPASIMMMPA